MYHRKAEILYKDKGVIISAIFMMIVMIMMMMMTTTTMMKNPHLWLSRATSLVIISIMVFLFVILHHVVPNKSLVHDSC